jgi:hypothetical protein
MSTIAPSTYPNHVRSLADNMDEVADLVRIHIRVGGTGPGRRHRVEILNRSAIVLLVACWEAFVEDLASESFSALQKGLANPTVFPKKVLALAAKSLRENPDESSIWALAGDGWKTVLATHRVVVLDQFVGKLNTPRPGQVDQMFEKLIGLRNLSSNWKWKGMPNKRALENLEQLVTLRGEISHRVTAGAPVLKKHVADAGELVLHLAVIASNRVRTFIQSRTGAPPWDNVSRGGVS